jgi:hypothetical protein
MIRGIGLVKLNEYGQIDNHFKFFRTDYRSVDEKTPWKLEVKSNLCTTATIGTRCSEGGR